jgi:predicted RNA-binding Zn ribbon-like protein
MIRPSAQVFDLTGGRVCLDLPNTVENRPVERRRDLLASYADLVGWAEQARLLTNADGGRLLAAASRRPGAAAAILVRAKALREALFGVYAALAAGRIPPQRDWTALEVHLRAALQHTRLERTPRGFAWGWARASDALDRVLWPVARDAADFLTSGDLSRLRVCAADDCGWLFLDESRNRTRVWCNMQVCGNREKARRHYARSKRQG